DGEVLNEFIADVNAAAPGLHLSRDDVVRVFYGLLPSTRPGSARLAKRPDIVDHGARGGAQGLLSMIGIKFTTARRTAAKTLRLCGLCDGAEPATPAPQSGVEERARSLARVQALLSAPEMDFIMELADAESVCNVDDLVLRRLGLIDEPVAAER